VLAWPSTLAWHSRQEGSAKADSAALPGLPGLPHRARPHSRPMTQEWQRSRPGSFRDECAYKVAPWAAFTSFMSIQLSHVGGKTTLLELFVLGTGMTKKGPIARPLCANYSCPMPGSTRRLLHPTLLHMPKSPGRPETDADSIPAFYPNACVH
jgi:hypothetical protein